MAKPTKRPLSESFKDHPFIGGVLLIGAVAGAIATSLQFGASAVRLIGGFFDSDTRPPKFAGEYDTLDLVSLGASKQFIEERFGSPWRIESVSIDHEALGRSAPSEPGRMYSFRAPGHVVSILADSDGGAIGLAVTSCTQEFHGRLTTPLGEVVLNETPMSELGTPDSVGYGYAGSSGYGGFLQDQVSGDTTAMDHTDVMWGRYYTCSPGGDDPYVSAADLGTVTNLPGAQPGAFVGEYDPALNEFRSRWLINGVLLLKSDLGSAVRADFSYFVEGGRHGDL